MNELKSDAITDLIEDNFFGSQNGYCKVYFRFPVDLLVGFLLHLKECVKINYE